MKDELFLAIFIAIVILILAIVIFLPGELLERDCAIRGDATGYNTSVIYGECYVELLEGVWVPDNKLIYYLGMIK